MSQFLSHNGKLILAEKYFIAPENRSFRYGDGFFETIRIRNGKPLWLDYHIQRMNMSAEVLKIKLQNPITSNGLSEQIEELCKENNHIRGARVRLSVYRSDGGFYLPKSNTGEYFIETTELESEEYHLNKHGLNIGLYRKMMKPPGQLSNVKTSSALIYVMASLYGKENGLNDAILLNTNGNIAEATSSNIFLVTGDQITTPALREGCVDGVMRKVILDIASELDLTIRECVIKPEELQTADEVFLTNTIKGIQWVKGTGNKRYYHEMSSMLISKLNELATDIINS